ncbi:penicillin-binding protein 1A [Henriciella marina]|uniref:penicillin-binding protein 1A n=1 Tax=Henriciella marina TaxID=453851 RepID=UPI000376C9F9|nr:penicillin-binding protein 1A [Henriciella marina]
MSEQSVWKRYLTWKLARRVAIGIFIIGALCFVALVLWVAALSRDLPSHERLADYEPPITSRVHAGDGTLIAEFAEEHRVFVPIESMPDHVTQAFVAAEDKKFFEHDGLDYVGILRGAINSAQIKLSGSDGNLQGGSTITQQVAKNMLLTRDQRIERKVKEAIIARRMENTFTKDQILELYLNEIYLGVRAYGVGSAALIYFNKSLPELSLSEAAVLASLAKAPSTVNPYRRPQRLLARRNYVLNRMLEDGYITEEEAEEAKSQPLEVVDRLRGPEYAAATYFVQELRRDLIEEYGEEALERGGLSIRTTLDTQMQLAAQNALQSGLETYDRRHGYRGPFTSVDASGDVAGQLQEVERPAGFGDWEAGMVRDISGEGAVIVLNDGRTTSIPDEDVRWANSWDRPDGGEGLARGDVILVDVERTEELKPGAEAPAEGELRNEEDWIAVPSETATLKQVPAVEGAIVALDPHTGRVLAMVGGYSFFKSPFNRVTQGMRQPGSAFKPFVYAAALENGYTPSTQILDSPFVYFDQVTGQTWKPQNYSAGRSYGEVTMRTALERSFNQVTARVAVDIGMEDVSELAERFGLYDDLPAYPAMALGSGDTTPWRMARGYAAFVNGGKEVTPTLLDRVQDRHGQTLYRHDKRACEGCVSESWDGETPPELADDREQLIDPVIAYQVVHMLEGVVERGTARRAASLNKPLAGKTGTTNDYFDALFYGFSPDLVVGVWVGFDQPRTLGNGEAGGSVALPVFVNFMKEALEDAPAMPFRIPPGVRLVSVDHDTGGLPTSRSGEVIVEAFRPGTEPGAVFDEDDGFSISGNQGASMFGGNDTADPSAEGFGDNPPEEDDVADENLGGIY